MHGPKGERVSMRVHIGERDGFKGRPLYAAIVELLRAQHYAGARLTRPTSSRLPC
jgi:PII-like signaling protein